MGGELTWQAVSNVATVIGILVVIFGMALWAAKILTAISSLGRQVGALDGRMGALDGRMGALEGRMGALEGQMGAVEGRVANNEKAISELRTEIIENGKAIAVIQGFLMPWFMVRGGSGDASDQFFKKIFDNRPPSDSDEEKTSKNS